MPKKVDRRIGIFSHPSRDFRDYHCTVRISNFPTGVIFWQPDFGRNLKDGSLKIIGKRGASLLRGLFASSRVLQVHIYPYKISISVNEWDGPSLRDLDKPVIEAIKKSLGGGDIEVQWPGESCS